MQNMHQAKVSATQVMALFADSSLSFNLSNGATFADLANRLECLGAQHVGLPMEIYLKFASVRQPIVVSRKR